MRPECSKALAMDWTKDSDGEYIDWTKPPYCVGGVLNFLLPGEEPGNMPRATWIKRHEEFMKLRKRQMRS